MALVDSGSVIPSTLSVGVVSLMEKITWKEIKDMLISLAIIGAVVLYIVVMVKKYN